MILTGNNKIKLFAGATKVRAAYVGAAKVYPNSSLAVTASLAFAAAGGSAALSIQVEDGQAWSLSGLPTGWTASATSGTGSAAVTITAPNNTTTTAKGATITVVSEDLTATCAVNQAAGAMVYGAWTNSALIADTYNFAAAGGTTGARVRVDRVWTWNGVPGSGGVQSTNSNLVSAAGYPSWISASADSLTCPSLGTTQQAQSTYRIECQSELASNRVSATFTQEANNWWDGHIELYAPSTIISAAGGAITLSWQLFRHWTSGAQNPVGPYGSLTGAAGGFSVNGDIVSAENRTTVLGVARSITVAIEYYGLTSNAITIAQEANYIVEQQIMPGTLQFTPSYVSRENGGLATCKTKYANTWEWKYTSGATTATAPPAEYGTISARNDFYANPPVEGASVDDMWGHVTWDINLSTSSRSVNVIRDVIKTLTPDTAAYPGAPTLVATQRYQGVSRQY